LRFNTKRLLALFTLFWWGITSSSTAAEQLLIFVVHPENPISSIKVSDLSKIFLKKTTVFKSGQKIIPLDLIPSKVSFYEKFLGKRLDRIQQYWLKSIFSGRKTPPKEFKKIEGLLIFVRSNLGAIAYLPPDVNIGNLKKIKVVP